MPVTFQLVPRRNLLVARYSGLAGVEETVVAAEAASRLPGFHPGMRHLVDLAGITDYERDFVAFFRMQARLGETYARVPAELVISYYAPTRIAHEMAQLARRSWEGLDLAVIRIFDTEEAALGFLGVPETGIAQLIAMDA